MKIKPSIVTVTCLSIGTLVALAVASALWLGLSSATKNTRRLLESQAGIFMDLVEQRIESRLQPAVDQGNWITDRIQDDSIDPTDETAFDTFISGTLAATPQVAGITFVNPDGLSRRWRRADGQSLEEQWSGRREIMLWLELGANGSQPEWREPFYTETISQYVVLHDMPIRKDGVFLGMLGQIVSINDLSAELSKITEGSPLVPFILYNNTHVMAHPDLAVELQKPATQGQQLPEVSAFADPVLLKLNSNDLREMRLMSDVDRASAKMTWTNDSAYAILRRTIDRYGEDPWIIGFYFDLKAEDNTVVDRLIAAIVAGVAVFFLSVLFAVLLGRRLSKPIASIAGVAEQISEGDFTHVKNLPTSRVKEIHSANLSINQMVDDLREQELIRDTLGRYLPEPVARSILREQGELAPQTSVATVLFCDVAGFTSLSEEAGAEATIKVLNAYFSEAVAILEKHLGVITQFQGDGILAVFNLPVTNPQHAYSAVMAALELIDCVKHQTFFDKQIAIRIGISTGEVVAGAVGAKGRLSYTVHGNAVNNAARIESINKTTNTHLLISASTAQQLQKVQARSVGTFDIRGSSEQAELFTVETIDQTNPNPLK